MPLPFSCIKCGGIMEEGFIVDNDRYPQVSKWVIGVPSMRLFGTVKADRQDQFRVRTFACMNCGYLESYLALEE